MAGHDPSRPEGQAVACTAVVDGGSAHAFDAGAAVPVDVASDLQTWTRRGLDRFDPVAVWTIEALLRRAAGLGSRTRSLVEANARRRLAVSVARFERSAGSLSADGSSPPSPAPTALGELLVHIARHRSLVGTTPSAPRAPDTARIELKALTYFQATWATLSADRRLRQSLSSLPQNAGPLNSQRLVHRALEAMRELSPAYLERFIEHVDTLLWLDHASGGPPAAGNAVLHAEPVDRPAGKPARKRPRRKAD